MSRLFIIEINSYEIMEKRKQVADRSAAGKKYHFVYKLTFIEDPRYYYYGKHSTNIEPSKDPYMGSGKHLNRLKAKYGTQKFSREILGVFNTLEEALLAEEKLVGDLWKIDPFCLNRIKGGGFNGKFDCTGLIHVHKDGVCKDIDPDYLEIWEKEGWKRGQPKTVNFNRKATSEAVKKLWQDPSYREHMKLAHQGNKCHLGHTVSAEGREKMRQAGLRRAWVHNKVGDKISIEKTELEKYLREGWLPGSGNIRKVSDEYKKHASFIAKERWRIAKEQGKNSLKGIKYHDNRNRL